MARVMEITTPLGSDVLLFHGMHAREEIGRMSEYQLDLLSKKGDVNVDDILGKNVTIKLELPGSKTRYFNGFVTRFAQGGTYGRYHRYFAVVRPWLWMLTRTSDCRIFQDKTVPDIIKEVFGDHSTADFKNKLTGSYRKWTYCVQYRETDFNFVSRLMEQEGIYYYFTHEDGRHTLVLADSYSGHEAAPGCEQIPYIAPDRLVRPDQEHVSEWSFRREIQPGAFVHDDYDLEKPSVELQTKKTVQRKHALADYEIYDYPGEYVQKSDGQQYAEVRMDEYSARFEIAEGIANARGLRVGALLKVKDLPRGDQNREYLVLSANHTLEFNDYEALPTPGGASYRCSFASMPSQQQLRPIRSTPKPMVQGPQTAVVVGPSGDEIYTDKYGRVKVQFHWDRYGKKDENSSCWIRVSHPWAGKNWGMIAIPRIGQEVIVDFLEGDPDQPIITGRVYNAEQMPPYELPANMTQTGALSRSSKSGTGANANEFRFEDKKGSEQVYLHAEKNQDISVENDETHSVGHDRTKTIDHDETTHVKHDRTETVDNNETITIGVNRTEKVGSNETITIGANRTISVGASESATVALQRTHAVGINETITVGAAQEIAIGGFQVLGVGAYRAVSVGGYQTTSIGATQKISVGTDRSLTVGANENIKVGATLSTEVGSDETRKVGGKRSTDIGKDDEVKIGKNLVIDAGDSVTITTGSASITMKKDGTITIKGKDITIEATSKIVEKATNITSEASAKSVTKGAMIDVDASGVNTIKGSLVKIN